MHLNPSNSNANKPTQASKIKSQPTPSCGCSHEKETTAPTESFTPSTAPAPSASVPKSEGKETQSQAKTDPKVKVTVYAQDPHVAEAITMEIPKTEIGSNLQSERVKINDNRTHVAPNAQGDYILAEGSDGISQVNALVFTTDTLQLFEDYRGSEIPWATRGDQISVTPHKQEGRNAYYSRWGGGTNYFFSHSPGLDTVMKTANSTDVVSHETGHALLDGLRPGYFGTHDAETGAFHEAFGDCAAMLLALREASNRDSIMDTTGGDLSKHSVLSSLAEEFGAARAFDNDDPSDDHKIWLRTAHNDFTYKPPSELPPGRGDDNNLGREVHSFGRLFAAAFYDTIESVYKQAISEDKQSPKEALQTAERVTGPLLTRAVEGASTSRARFGEIALGMIAADGTINDGKYSDGLKKVFLDRKFITPDEIQQDQDRRAKVPALQLPADLSRANAVNFLEANAEALNIPADLPYVPDSVSKNGRGETFVSFRYHQEVPVSVSGLEDKVTDLQGGVNLVFDSSGKLIDRLYTEITPETVSDEMTGIADMQAKNAIVEKEALNLFKSDVDTSLFKSSIDGNKIVRIPVSGCNHDHGH